MRMIAITMSVLCLVACGGGGGGGGSSNGGGSPYGPGDTSFRVSAVNPANGAAISTFPNEIQVTFSRTLDANTVNENSVTVEQSGGDSSFGDGNETILTWNALSVASQTLTLDFTGTNITDTFQITILGDGANAVMASDATVLDGDADGSAGGNFVSTFSVDAAQPSNDTLTAIQANVFNVSCALSGCHTGSSPAAGMNLSEGNAFTNIVGVASTEVPSLQRIEPGNPDDSYLIQKVSGTAAVGVQMPPGGTPLSNELIENLRDWVTDGALDN